jgi:HK97 family phage major capsid protein
MQQFLNKSEKKMKITSRVVWSLLAISAVMIAQALGYTASAEELTAGGLMLAGIGEIELKDINDLIEKQGKAFEEFKSTHEEQIKELKAGKDDPLIESKLQKINDHLDQLQDQKDEIEKKLNRQKFFSPSDDSEEKNLIIFNNERKAAAISSSRPQPADIDAEQYREYKKAFGAFMRKGHDHLEDMERKAMTVGSDAEGGYLVPADVSGRIVSRLYELSPIRKIASVQPISSDALEGIEDLNEADAGWVGETSTRSETNTPNVGKWRIPVQEMYAQPKATQKLLDDAAVDVETWLSNKIADKLARLEGAAFISGDGVNRPRGFASYMTAATADGLRTWGQLEHIATGVSSDFAASNPSDHLLDLIMAFKSAHLNNANWVTRRTVIAKIRKFKEATTNAYMWQPGLQAGQPSTLLGFPVVMAEDMPALASGSLSMALGNFQAYQIVDRLGIRVLRGPFTDKPYVKFYTTKRTGGGVLDFEAIKFIKFGT